ncbi:hypothetical protein [Peptoniphilus rhinitidis]|uniref:hypothetical protein n=1 Tax=Peptoniphilus rhinitidis TaxID=1175452 RepID=UPI000288D5BE|nr:hypothetical protein [Peptoniphilus rhinitidis]
MTDNLKDLPVSNTLKDKWLLSWDETQQKFARVSPKMLTSTIYTEDGTPLDELLKVTPSELAKMVEDILEGAPEAYNTFLEVSQALEENKDSISEIFREISKRIVRPDGGKIGQVLKLDDKGKLVFADDQDTIYEHPLKHSAEMIETNENRSFVSEKEKTAWNNKLDKDSSLNENKISLQNREDLLKNILEEILKFNTSIKNSIGSPNGIASLDGNSKVPLRQLPDEALRDTTYDLSLYARTEDIEKTYAEITALNTLKKAIEETLEAYIKKVDLDKFNKAINTELEKKEDAIHRGAANGYASLNELGKVPKEQLPEEAIRVYDLGPYAKTEDVKRTFATKEEVVAGKLDYTPEDVSKKGKAGGYASLGDDGKVPSSQLPSYVDDVMEFESKSKFPKTGEKGKIYVDLSSENIFRWSGSAYVEISPNLITQADIKKLQGIEDGAQKNNVTQSMIDGWNKKISAGEVEATRITVSSGEWGSLTLGLSRWISELLQRTEELKKELAKKPDVIEMSLSDYNALPIKKPNTIYAID